MKELSNLSSPMAITRVGTLGALANDARNTSIRNKGTFILDALNIVLG
jgi:hypothetical protein